MGNELWRKKQSDVMRFLLRIRTWEYRHLPAIHRCSRSSRPEKARHMGYKKKQGIIIYRVRVMRGGRKRKAPKGIVYGKPKNCGINRMNPSRSHQALAESRAGKKLPTLRVLNSYWVAQDAKHLWYEVILIDPYHSAIRNDPHLNWICKPNKKHRELRGLTSAGKKSRGLRAKGSKANKCRPSRKGNYFGRMKLTLWKHR